MRYIRRPCACTSGEGLLAPSRSEGNTRLYTDEDLKRLEFILELAREYGVNISGIDMILRMRQRMEQMKQQMDLMQTQMQEFIRYVQTEMIQRVASASADSSAGALVPVRRPAPERKDKEKAARPAAADQHSPSR